LQKYIEDPLSEALIQGSLPRPAELEIYLGDTGIYFRQVKESKEGEEVAVGAESRARRRHAAVHVLRDRRWPATNLTQRS